MDIQAADKTLRNLGTFNLLLGKNGSGKSTILRNLDNALTGKGKVVYLAPERGGGHCITTDTWKLCARRMILVIEVKDVKIKLWILGKQAFLNLKN